MPDAVAREGAVVIPLQHAALAQPAVPGPGRNQLVAFDAVVPQVSLAPGRILPLGGRLSTKVLVLKLSHQLPRILNTMKEASRTLSQYHGPPVSSIFGAT